MMTKFEVLQELENFYDAMTPAQEKSNESFVWFSGLPHPLFNAVMHLTIDKNLDDKVDQLIARVPNNAPVSFWAHSQNGSNNLKEAVKKRGFQPIGTCPLMTWTVKPIAVSNYQIEVANLEIFYDLIGIAFHFDEVIKKWLATVLEKVEAENYSLYHDGQPVGMGTLIPNGKVGGIFNIATLPEYQKRGFGRAMMQFLMNRAFILGLERVVLLSSPIAEKLYTSLEFTKCFDVEIYAQ